MLWIMAFSYIGALVGLLHAGFYFGSWVGLTGAIALWAMIAINTWSIVFILVRRT